MPQELKIGPYSVFLWSNENDPLEPVHVHIYYRRESGAERSEGVDHKHREDIAV